MLVGPLHLPAISASRGSDHRSSACGVPTGGARPRVGLAEPGQKLRRSGGGHGAVSARRSQPLHHASPHRKKTRFRSTVLMARCCQPALPWSSGFVSAGVHANLGGDSAAPRGPGPAQASHLLSMNPCGDRYASLGIARSHQSLLVAVPVNASVLRLAHRTRRLVMPNPTDGVRGRPRRDAGGSSISFSDG